MMRLPKVITGKPKEQSNFPVPHYSPSSMIKFSTNPILFKIEYINGDRFDTAMNVSAVVGRAFHKAMEVYYGGNEEIPVPTEADAILQGLKVGTAFLEKYNDGFIHYSKTIPNKQKALDTLAFLYNAYVKEKTAKPPKQELVSTEEEMFETVDIEWKGKRLALPVPLKGYADKIVREDGKLKIYDYKTVRSYSDHERIDGAKIIQAVHYYLLAYAKYKEQPHSMTYLEVKSTKNSDGSPQVREYEMVFAENELYFDFYFRFYEDMTRALLGQQVYVPNVLTMFDNEVSMVAYLHRLDVNEEQAKLLKKHKVDNITDLLKKQIQSAGNMKKLMKTMESQLLEAKNINYSTMENHEKIQTKLLEHGMVLHYHSKKEGASVDLYQYNPTIGLRMKRLEQYTADIEQVLGTSGVRILAPIPNTEYVGFEVPRKERTFPQLPSTVDFNIAVGQTIMEEPRRFDIRTAPHILVAGSSGSGKSVWLGNLIRQIGNLPTKTAKLHLYDPKIVELAEYADLTNVEDYKTDPVDIRDGLMKLVQEMNERYKTLAKARVKSIEQYQGQMPYKVVVIDEYGDLIMQRLTITDEDENKIDISAEIEKAVLLLAQKARGAGIHMVVSTQRPSTDVITGTIKTNFPTKVVFRTAKASDSRVVMDESGAEKLLGRGDMIFASEYGHERLQGYAN